MAKDLGVTIWDNRLYPVPKHVWEGQDPTTFDFFPPVCLAQYSYMDHDPNGNWAIWKLRDDWERTSVGQILEKAGPPYVMWNFVGTEEKRILSMISNDIDILQDITPESMQVLTEKSPNTRCLACRLPLCRLRRSM